MIGKEVTLQDIVLELNELQPEVQPVDLFCEEELPTEQDTAEEEPEKVPFKVVAPCGCCGARLRLFLFATNLGIHTFETLLLEEVSLLCPTCRESIQHGGQ